MPQAPLPERSSSPAPSSFTVAETTSIGPIEVGASQALTNFTSSPRDSEVAFSGAPSPMAACAATGQPPAGPYSGAPEPASELRGAVRHSQQGESGQPGGGRAGGGASSVQASMNSQMSASAAVGTKGGGGGSSSSPPAIAEERSSHAHFNPVMQSYESMRGVPQPAAAVCFSMAQPGPSNPAAAPSASQSRGSVPVTGAPFTPSGAPELPPHSQSASYASAPAAAAAVSQSAAERSVSQAPPPQAPAPAPPANPAASFDGSQQLHSGLFYHLMSPSASANVAAGGSGMFSGRPPMPGNWQNQSVSGPVAGSQGFDSSQLLQLQLKVRREEQAANGSLLVRQRLPNITIWSDD